MTIPIDYSIPGELDNLLSEEDYRRIAGYAIDHLSTSLKDIALADGQIRATDAEGSTVLVNLVNLVKNILVHDQADWQPETVEYLEKFGRDQDLEAYLYTDFDIAQAYLTVRLQPKGIFENPDYPGMAVEEFIYRTDLEDLYTVLSFDLPNRFAMIRREYVADWRVSDADLFAIARQNLTQKLEDISCRQLEAEGATIITLFDRDYSASVAVDFAHHCGACIGSLGSVVCFPSKGSVFIHPIEEAEEFNKAYHWLVERVNDFYDEEPGPLTRNFYWYYAGSFEQFGTEWEGNYLTYNIPEALVGLLS
jgi:hypothetical protein